MDAHTLRKFCTVCKLSNDANAVVCQHCSASLVKASTEVPTTRRVEDPLELIEEIQEQAIREHTPPPLGLSLLLLNNGEHIALCMEQEFILGRAADSTVEPMVDLTNYDAFTMGVSRRHAMIKAVEDKYILTDLNSSNGTWLNGQRLVPTKLYDLPSGGVIMLGRLKLIVIFLNTHNSKNKA